MSVDYDDSDLTPEEMIAAAAGAFDDADIAGPIPADPVTSEEDLEDLAPSRSEQFQAILQRSQERLECEGPVSADEVRRHLGL
jgi:hypothetical protein